jgi:hypothetical protein
MHEVIKKIKAPYKECNERNPKIKEFVLKRVGM